MVNKLKVILTFSRKGGTGKTTVSFALAACLAQKSKVCIIDCDTYAPAWEYLFDYTSSIGKGNTGLTRKYLHNWIASEEINSASNYEEIKEIINSSNTTEKINDYLQFPKIEGIPLKNLACVLQSSEFSANNSLNEVFARKDLHDVTHKRLMKLLYEIKAQGYEIVIFDSSPGIRWLTTKLMGIIIGLEKKGFFVLVSTPMISDAGGVFYDIEMFKNLLHKIGGSYWLMNGMPTNSKDINNDLPMENGVSIEDYSNLRKLHESLSRFLLASPMSGFKRTQKLLTEDMGNKILNYRSIEFNHSIRKLFYLKKKIDSRMKAFNIIASQDKFFDKCVKLAKEIEER